MKKISNMSLGELAAFISSHLRNEGMNPILSGGACVSILTANRYQSYDLDFIDNMPVRLKKLNQAMSQLGFVKEGRHFSHPETEVLVEFPSGPLAVGSEPAGKTVIKKFKTGDLELLAPTDCVKDRLAGYYHWNDEQCLEQAVLVARDNEVDLNELARWSQKEGKGPEFKRIKDSFS